MLDNVTAPLLGTIGSRAWFTYSFEFHTEIFMQAHKWDSVDTDIDMAAREGAEIWTQPLFGYPWDVWTGEIVLTTVSPILCHLVPCGLRTERIPYSTLNSHKISPGNSPFL